MNKRNIIRIVICMFITLYGSIVASKGSNFFLTIDFPEMPDNGGRVLLNCKKLDGSDHPLVLWDRGQEKSGTRILDQALDVGQYKEFKITRLNGVKSSFYNTGTTDPLCVNLLDNHVVHFAVKYDKEFNTFVAYANSYQATNCALSLALWGMPNDGNVSLGYDGPFGNFKVVLWKAGDYAEYAKTIKLPVGKYKKFGLLHQGQHKIPSIEASELEILNNQLLIDLQGSYELANENSNEPHIEWNIEKF